MSQMFQYEVWPPSAPNKMYTIDDFIGGGFYTKKGKSNVKILLHVFLSSASTVYSTSVR